MLDVPVFVFSSTGTQPLFLDEDLSVALSLPDMVRPGVSARAALFALASAVASAWPAQQMGRTRGGRDAEAMIILSRNLVRFLSGQVIGVQSAPVAWPRGFLCDGQHVRWNLQDPLKAVVAAIVEHIGGALPMHRVRGRRGEQPTSARLSVRRAVRDS